MIFGGAVLFFSIGHYFSLMPVGCAVIVSFFHKGLEQFDISHKIFILNKKLYAIIKAFVNKRKLYCAKEFINPSAIYVDKKY